MVDESSFVRFVEAAGPDELANIFNRPSVDEEKALQLHLGDERYRRMHRLALRRKVTRARAKPIGNVVIIHGFMGATLATSPPTEAGGDVWLDPRRLATGGFDLLRLEDEGRSAANGDELVPSGVMKRHYGELMLSLSGRWNVRAFVFDWRKDIRLAAAQLDAEMASWFNDDEPVHLVGHGTGGLVARAFIKSNPERWAAMWDAPGAGLAGGRLVMLGSPNSGSFAPVKWLTGVHPLASRLAQLVDGQNPAQIQQLLATFAGLFEMLPDPELPGAEALYSSSTYKTLAVRQRHLDDARRLHRFLDGPVEAERMVYVAGDNRPTPAGINDYTALDKSASYDVSLAGDGVVTHQLGQLAGADGTSVPMLFADDDHGGLTSNPAVLAAVDELLETGSTDELKPSPAPPGTAPGREGLPDEPEAVDIDRIFTRVRNRSVGLSVDDRRASEVLTRGLLSSDGRRASVHIPIKPVTLSVALVHGRIDEAGGADWDLAPIDAIAVGHYLGARPEAAELALDRSVSAPLPGKVTPPSEENLLDVDLLLTQLAERGTIRGELGQPFFLPDPRPGPSGRPGERLLAVAGMGVPGRFGIPELTVLVRELSWSLGRLGRRHLATVLIGAGVGNIPVGEAVSAWLRGVKHALSGSFADDQRRITHLTFVEADGRKLRPIQDAILGAKAHLAEADRLIVEYQPLDEECLRKMEHEVDAEAPPHDVKPSEPAPTRITLSLDGSTYRFGAITDSASIPERDISIDPALVMRANDELAAESDPDMQVERGLFLERLLIPHDLRSELYTGAPLVMLLDSSTARIHWELLAQSELSTTSPTSAGTSRQARFESAFLSTGRGLTRQLRSTFAPPPEPPPPPRRVLRVLVVADPAEDAPLPGAEEEGGEVAELFEAFNEVYETITDNRIEVEALFGPRQATRTNVLRHLLLRSFDVLHFAGHCLYDREDPPSSGWLFSGGARLTARELDRIDRVPKFVFSNACESGITPDRSDRRSVELAPSFAESFFKRGVSNFVCTAWPVDDAAAREFAVNLYSGLLGLERDPSKPNRPRPTEPQPMHRALTSARLSIAREMYGATTWGAYQHYGNPYLRFFDISALKRREADEIRARAAAAEAATSPAEGK